MANAMTKKLLIKIIRNEIFTKTVHPAIPIPKDSMARIQHHLLFIAYILARIEACATIVYIFMAACHDWLSSVTSLVDHDKSDFEFDATLTSLTWFQKHRKQKTD